MQNCTRLHPLPLSVASRSLNSRSSSAVNFAFSVPSAEVIGSLPPSLSLSLSLSLSYFSYKIFPRCCQVKCLADPVPLLPSRGTGTRAAAFINFISRTVEFPDEKDLRRARSAEKKSERKGRGRDGGPFRHVTRFSRSLNTRSISYAAHFSRTD